MRALGVGLVYWAALEPLLDAADAGIAVAELEPETLWEQVGCTEGWRYRNNDALLERVAALPQAKLLHGVGHPVGGTVADPIDPAPLLRHAVERLDPVWVSEHLGFNRIRRPDGAVEHAGFLLPPPQSSAAVRVAVQNLAAYRRTMARPVAFETGVNYLRPQAEEISDGDFFAEVANGADSGIVLDLHNLWCNERNGRTHVMDVVNCLPLERIWEIHFAGGMSESNYWIDAHSGGVPDEVMDIAAGLIPRLPNLGALIFEILPEHLSAIGLDGVQRQIEGLKRLWTLRRPDAVRPDSMRSNRALEMGPTAADLADVARWESSLVAATHSGATPATASSASLSDDLGYQLLAHLVRDARRANLARTLRYSLTALLAGVGPQETHALLDAYCEQHPPEPFAAVEADAFAYFLRERLPLLRVVAYLDEVLAFEHAMVRATVHGARSELVWSADPVSILASLDAGMLPPRLPGTSITMRICAD